PRQGPLCGYGGSHRVAPAPEDREKRVALAVDLDAAGFLKRRAKQGPMHVERFAVEVAPERLQQSSRALDVAEEKGERAVRQLAGHADDSRPRAASPKDWGQPWGAPTMRTDT